MSFIYENTVPMSAAHRLMVFLWAEAGRPEWLDEHFEPHEEFTRDLAR
jgi:hypothetical protein